MICVEIAALSTHGWFMGSGVKKQILSLDNDRIKNVSIDSIEDKFFNLGEMRIYDYNISFISKYYISGLGRVWRFSKLEKKLDSIKEIAINKSINHG